MPSSVLAEGYSMLRSVVSDFKAAEHEVTVLLDERISKLNPPMEADYIVPILYNQEPKSFLKDIARTNDAIFVIAPETDSTLQSIIQLAEATGKVSLNCSSRTVAEVSDKLRLNEKLSKLGFAPKTLATSADDNLAKVKRTIKSELGYPAILKPTDGASCAGLSVVNDERQVEQAIVKIKLHSGSKRFIAQQYVRGEPASVSLLCNGKKAAAISLNKQNIKLSTPSAESSYEGGAVPFDHPLKQKAFEVAQRAVEAFDGLKGYVGVDVVLADSEVFIVDLNARLTTSYVGLHRVAGFNIAAALVDAVLEGKLPNKRANDSFSCFSKVETPRPNLESFRKCRALEGVVCPPFPVEEGKACAMVAGDGVSLQAANAELEKVKAHLIDMVSRGG